MELNISTRIQLPQILPKEGSLTDQIICKGILEKIQLTSEEIERFEVRSLDNGAVQWNPEKEEKIEPEFTEVEIKILKDAVKKLDEEKKVTLQLIDLCQSIKDL